MARAMERLLLSQMPQLVEPTDLSLEENDLFVVPKHGWKEVDVIYDCIHIKFNFESKTINVHDELLFDFSDSIPLRVRALLQNADEFNVTFKDNTSQDTLVKWHFIERDEFMRQTTHITKLLNYPVIWDDYSVKYADCELIYTQENVVFIEELLASDLCGIW